MFQDHTTRKQQWGLKPRPRGTKEGRKIQRAVSRQFKAAQSPSWCQDKGLLLSRVSQPTNGQKGALGRLCPLPGLGQHCCPLPTCLLRFKNPQPCHSVSQTSISWLQETRASPHLPSQDLRTQDGGRRSKEQEDLGLGSFSLPVKSDQTDITLSMFTYSPVAC